ncbi:hypothetical protein R3W88_009696 [Solanum pinnatisectum]|uniref:Uncharacterized protein n=1 Tax=Solanum pinnatisectum TaxID=50273 RepID=A0AAV9MEF8_9SOLN|nr:hypothetical protein R3W88_009696 [Solanum pinnatisectum]
MEPMDIVGKTKEDASLPKEKIKKKHFIMSSHHLKGVQKSSLINKIRNAISLAAQQRMFAEARARMNGVVTVPPKQQDPETEQKLDC